MNQPLTTQKRTIPNDQFFAWVETELADGRNVKFRIRGTSMLPLLRDGKEEVVVSPPCEDEPQLGEVVLFRYQGRHVLHRVIHQAEGVFRLQGDGVFGTYEECRSEDIVGIVRQVIRPDGRVVETSSARWRQVSQRWLWLKRHLICHLPSPYRLTRLFSWINC